MKLGSNSAIASDLLDRLGDICDACAYIDEAGACNKCPMEVHCLKENDVLMFGTSCTEDTVKEFMDFADDVENYANQQDFENYHEWLEAERERELWVG